MLGSAARVFGATTRLVSQLAGAEKDSEAWTAEHNIALSGLSIELEDQLKKWAKPYGNSASRRVPIVYGNAGARISGWRCPTRNHAVNYAGFKVW